MHRPRDPPYLVDRLRRAPLHLALVLFVMVRAGGLSVDDARYFEVGFFVGPWGGLQDS